MLGLVTSLKMMMVVGLLNLVVLQIVPPNECSTIPSTPVAKDRVCCSDASCHLLEYEELVLVFVTCVDLPVPFCFLILGSHPQRSRLLVRVKTS